MCLAFDRTKDLSGDYNDVIPIFQNGSKLHWVKCVKYLGKYVSYDLLEEEEIRHKKGDFIWRVNGLLIGYRDAHPEVNMYLLNSYWCHLYGSQAVKQTKWQQHGIEESEIYSPYPLILIEICFVVSIMRNIYEIVFLKDFVVCVSLWQTVRIRKLNT